MDAATSGTPRPLPQRAELENALGHSLSDVEVYSGPEARAALETLGVQAAARGHQIAFANPAPTLPLVLHEAVHVLQSRNGGTGTASPVPLDSLAEREAVRFAHQADGGRLLPFRPVQAGLAAGAIGFATGVLDPPAPPVTAAAPPAPVANAALAPTPPAPTAMPSAPLAGSGTAGALTAGRQPAAVTGVGTAPVVGAAPAAGPAPVAGAGAAPAAGAAETAAAQPPVQLEGADIQGVVASFAEITPTQQAQTYAALGGRLQDVAQTEHASIEGSLPTFRANLPGETAPSQPLSPDAFASAPAPVDIPTPTLAAPAPVTAPDPGTAQAARAADAPPSSVPPQQRSDDIHQALRETQEAARVEGSPGPSPSVAQQAGADSSQLQTQADSAATQASNAQQQAAEAIRQGPGPEQVRPQALHAEATVGSVAPLSVAPPAPVPGTQQYLTMNLSPDVRGSFDQRVASERHGQMEQAHTQLQQATATRDSARDAAVAQANQDADTVRTTTVQDRNAAVETQRARIRTERANTVAQQEQAVSDAQGRIDSERTNHQQGIDTRVAADQRQIDDHYQRADADVQHQVDEGQRQADEKRREAERASEDESWFDRAVDWIADALEAFADAITKVFNAIKNAITTIIDAVVSLANSIIDAVVSFINEAIAALGAVLKALVQNLLGEIFPELAARLCRYIDEAVDLAQRAVTAIGNTLKEGIARVASAVKAAVNAVIGAFEAAVQIGVALLTAAVTGDFSAVLRKVLEAALAIAGISPEQFYAFIGRAEETFRIIIDAPGAFVGHLIDAFVGGVQRFASNFLTHLRNAIISWLTGALGGAGLRLPEHFDLMGVLSLVQQILGLTWDRIRQEIVRIIGERAVQIIEFIWSYVQTLMQGGWPALFERIKQDLSNLADMVLGAIKDYLLERVVIAAITRLATLFNPVGALVQLLLAAWNLYTFLRDQLARIRQVLAGIVAAIDNIARGVLGPAQEAVETILAGLLPLAIDLLARLLGLSGVGERVREIIHNVQEAIWRAIRSLIERVRGLFRGGGGPGAQAQQGAGAQGAAHIAEPFSLSGEGHTITADITGDQLALILASRRQGRLTEILDAAITEVSKRNRDHPNVADPELLQQLVYARREFSEQSIRQSFNAAGARGNYQQFVEVRINELIRQMTIAFQNSHIKSLDKLFESDEFKGPRFLPFQTRGSEWIRPNLYEIKRSWGSFRDAKVSTAQRLISDQVRAATAQSDQAAWQHLLDEHRLPEDPPAILGKFRPQDVYQVEYHLDHIHPVAGHWNGPGHNDVDTERDRFYFDPDNLQVVTKKYNLSKGSGGREFVDYVGQGFRSAIAEGDRPGAKTILNRTVTLPFLDENGNPVP